MKTISTLLMTTALVVGVFDAFAQNDPLAELMRRRAQEEQQLGGAQTSDNTEAASETATTTASDTASAEAALPTTPAPVMDQAAMADLIASNGTNGIRLNFRNAPLDTVLNYLSAAAGFHIVLETPARGNVTVISSHPMSKDEAVELLNSVLNKNGLAAIRNEKFLTIVSQSDRGRNFPVKIWDSDPGSIPNNDEMVTQIIPIRFVEAQQLTRDLASFTSSRATIVANEAGNSIVITDTQANIRHLVEIIKAIDSSAEGETQIRVFPLKYANPTDVATLLGTIFPSQAGGNQNPIRFGGGRGGGIGGGGLAAFFNRGGGGGAAGGDSGSDSQNRIKKQTQVIAVADARTQSVVVTASKDLMDQIGEMMDKLDVPSPRDQSVYVVSTANADPQQLLQVLQNTFPANNTSGRNSSTTSSSQNSALMQRQQNSVTSQGNSSSRTTTGFGNSTLGGGGGGGSLR